MSIANTSEGFSLHGEEIGFSTAGDGTGNETCRCRQATERKDLAQHKIKAAILADHGLAKL